MHAIKKNDRYNTSARTDGSTNNGAEIYCKEMMGTHSSPAAATLYYLNFIEEVI